MMKTLFWYSLVGCGLLSMIAWGYRMQKLKLEPTPPLYATLWKASNANTYLQIFPDHTLQYDFQAYKNCAVTASVSLQALGSDDFALLDPSNPLVLYSQSQVDQVSRLLADPLAIRDAELPATLEIWTQFQRVGQHLRIITKGFYFNAKRLSFHVDAQAKWRSLEYKQVFNTSATFQTCEN